MFQYLAKQKDVEVFAISMQDINYQLDKDKKPPTNPATRVPECYHNFLTSFPNRHLTPYQDIQNTTI